MTNLEKYKGKTVEIYAPFGGRFLYKGKVKNVLDDNVLEFKDTAFYLSDGITVKVIK